MCNKNFSNDRWPDDIDDNLTNTLWDDDFKYNEGSGADYDDFSENWETSDLDDEEDIFDYVRYRDMEDDRY